MPTLAHDRQQFRTHHGLGNDDLVAIHVGRLENSKGLQVLRHFVLGLARRKSRTRLVIQYLGNSSSQLLDQYAKIAQALKEDAPDNVRIVCDVDPRSERSVRYCDFLITPSLREVCPLVVLEAFLSGVPVISTNSTPFFRELDPDPIDSRFRQLLPLPDRFGNPWLTVSELYLNECESASLAEQLLAITDIAQVPGDVDRQLLADQARTAGFTLARMVADLKALYDSLNSRESLLH